MGMVVAIIITVLVVGIVVFNIIWSNAKPSSRQSYISNSFVDKNSKIKDMIIEFQSADGETLFSHQKGQLTQDSEFAIASISKLFTHTLIFQLIDEGKISYSTTLRDVLDEKHYKDLQVRDGTDLSGDLKIRQLIDQTTGLADYETDKLPDGRVIMDEVIKNDLVVSFDEALKLNRLLSSHDVPGKSAYYSNMNAMLLGKIAETIEKRSLADLYSEKICQPLKLENTRVAKIPDIYAPIYNEDNKLDRPEYIASGLAAGGVISTNHDLMKFMRGFFQGQLFDKKHVSGVAFKNIQFPMVRYGSGMMSIGSPRILSPLFPAPQIIGHSGSTGSFAYYCPSKDIFVTGTVNQVSSRPYQYIYAYLSTL